MRDEKGPIDPYAVLGIPRTASQSEIRKAYIALARRYHPDLHRGSRFAEEKFKQINEAYQTLTGNAAEAAPPGGPSVAGTQKTARRWRARILKAALYCLGGGLVLVVGANLVTRLGSGGTVKPDCGHSPPSPSETVRRHIELADKGNIDCAFQMLSHRQMNSEGGPNFVRGLIIIWIDAIHNNGGISQTEVTKEKIIGGSAQVDVRLWLGNDNSSERNYKLIKENDEWKIDEF
jgi:hypothetical protein